ncbi:hypothetical protein IJU97_01280 [bacterium]|nr:hypothetical protein [bacterium]
MFAAIENDTTESGKRIDAEDQKRLKEGIDSFIETHFKAHREKLEKKQTIPH